MATPESRPTVSASAALRVRPAWQTFWLDAWRRMRGNRLAMAGLTVVFILAVIASFAPLIAPYDPIFQDYAHVLTDPGKQFWLGTDNLGRDTLSRLIWGARVSLMVGVFTQVIILAIGLPVGSIAGFFGGRVDNLLMRFVDIVYGFPDLLLIILLRAVFGGSIFMVFLAIGLVGWSNIARLVRGQILSLKEQDFITSANAIGAPRMRIVIRHLLPNAIGPVIVAVTFGIPRAIFIEAALSYIGIGVRPPTPTWGTMIQDGYQVLFAAPHLVVAPALAIAVTMLAFTFVGDGVRDAFDPRVLRSRAMGRKATR